MVMYGLGHDHLPIFLIVTSKPKGKQALIIHQ